MADNSINKATWNKNYTATAKHVFAQSGREIKTKTSSSAGTKRKPSEGDELDAGLRQTKNIHLQETSSSSSCQSEPSDMSIDNIKAALRDVLKEPAVKEDLLSGLTSRIEKIETDIQQISGNNDKRLNDLQSNWDRTADQVSALQATVNKQEQEARVPRVVITGLEAHITKEKLVDKMNDLLSCNLSTDDLAWIQNLRTADSMKNKVRVVFKDEKKRDIWFKCKPELKGKNVWITDDLTPFTSGMAYQARQAVKQKRAQKTWVFRGRVFIIKNGETNPTAVTRLSDIPG